MNNYYLYGRYPMGYGMINESKGSSEGNTEWILSLGSIKFLDNNKKEVEVPCREFTKIVDMALGRIQSRFPYISPYIMHSKVMYVPYVGGMHDTMCVDSRKNLWINMPFVYNVLGMDTNKVYGILFHELMHNVLGHLDKIEEKFPIAKRMAMGEVGWDMEQKKINICTDMEVNCDMVADEVVTPGFWEKLHGVYDDDYKGKMWEQIYSKDGDKLFKRFVTRGDEIGEKTLEVLKAFEEYAEKISKPDATERDKERAKEELEKKLEEILGKDATKKDKKVKTIKAALQRLKNSLKKIGDLGEILDDLIDIYTITPERFDGEDYSRAIAAINKFKGSLLENAAEICSDSMHLEERSFREDINKCMALFKDNTTTVFEGKSSLPASEIARLNLDIAEALWVLLADKEAKKKAEEERKKREEEAKKKAEEKKKKAEEKKKKDARKSHLFFELFRKLANISNFIAIVRISEGTEDVTREIAESLRRLLDTPVEELTLADVEPFVDRCAELEDLLKDDLIALYDEHIIVDKTTTELGEIAKDAAVWTDKAIRTVADPSADIAEKRNCVVKAINALNTVGRLLRTHQKTKPSDEFKKEYMKEMKRLIRIAKTMGKEAIKKHLEEMGYVPETLFDGTPMDVVGTELDPESSDYGKGFHEPEEKEKVSTSAPGDLDEFEGTDIFEGTVYYLLDRLSEDDDTIIIEISDKPDFLPDDADIYVPIAHRVESDFPKYKLTESMEAVYEVWDKESYGKGKHVTPDFDELKKKLESNTSYKKGEWRK